MIFLDKNFTPGELTTVKAQIEELQAKQLALLPLTSGYESYPFSLSYLLQCYCRCLSRDDHLTLSNKDPVRLLQILILFYQQFKGV